MPPLLELSQIQFMDYELDLITIPDGIFFKDREEGILRPNTIPLPEGVKRWMRAKLQGEDVHAAHIGTNLYVLADTDVFGFTLFHYVSGNENDTTFRPAFSRGQRIITNERSEIIMSSLQQVANQMGAQRNGGGVSPMNLGGSVGVAPQVGGEGIGSGVDVARIKNEAQARGYVAGYIMGNAPQLAMALNRKKSAGGEVTVDICAKESKPSRMLAVCIALPANCITRNGGLATPTDISSGLVDYNTTNANEMMYLTFPVSQAVTYISALGYKLPEYAPHVNPGQREHWTRKDIMSDRPEVTYVYVKPSERRGKAATTEGRFNFTLKTTSPRKSLYTPNNHVCLRAVEHVPVKCNSEEDEYHLNDMAFGAWAYRKKHSEPENTLQKAMTACPSLIWRKQYTIDGKTVDGIGSAFFMAGTSTVTEGGESIAARPLTYYPWDQTGDRREAAGTRVERIVKRTLRAAEGDRKENMVVTPILYRENPNNKAFAQYAKFISFITSGETPFITPDKLKAMGARATKAKARSFDMTDDQKNALQYFMRSESVVSEMEDLRNEVARRAVLQTGN